MHARVAASPYSLGVADRNPVTPLYLDHFNNPRNVGVLERPDGSASTENPVCGDRLQLTVCLTGDVISEVAYKVLGCSGAIAAASAMSELVRGRTLDEARTIDRNTISEALGGLPTLKRHGADLASDGLQAVLTAATHKKESP